MAILRQFLYSDDDMAADFLAQLIGAEYDEQQITTENAGSSGFSAGLRAGPLEGGGNKDSSSRSSITTSMRQRRGSTFQHLLEELNAADLLRDLTRGIDETTWGQLQDGELIQCRCSLSRGPITTMLWMMGAMGAMGAMSNAMEMSDEDRAMFEMLTSMRDGMPERVIAEIVQSPKYHLLMDLERGYLLADPAKLQGDLFLVAKVARVLGDDAEVPSEDVAPELAGLIGVEQLAELDNMSELSALNAGPAVVRGPAAVVHPVAIFR